MQTQFPLDTIIPVTEARRNFGRLLDLLQEKKEIVLTKSGWPYATLKISDTQSKKNLSKSIGGWNGTALEEKSFWNKVLKKKSRKRVFSL